MKILVTGANGFVGRNLVWNLKAIQDGKNMARPDLHITEIYCIDAGTDRQQLESGCKRADFIFHLAGVNRPEDPSDYMTGNFEFTAVLLNILMDCGNTCPVMFASSIQASLAGRFAGSEYGRSKLAGEELLYEYSRQTGAKVCIYRFPNLFGKWCKPNYNSVVATFCNAVANDLEYTVNDPSAELELVYIDDLVSEMLDALEGKEHRCGYKGVTVVPAEKGNFCYVPVSYHAALGRIVELLNSFRSMSVTHFMPEIPADSFEKKLYTTYLSYLPEGKMSYSFSSYTDSRGSFTEIMRTHRTGQISVNVAKPGITRGQHWHNSKWEIFIVVSGHGLIQERRIGIDPETQKEYPVIEFEVTGDQMKAVQMLPGYTHNIINLSETENLVTVIWTNEQFDENCPDTFFEPVISGQKQKD